MSAHVLVADDETLIRQSIRTVLADEGFEVTVAASGAEAWRRFQEDRPDVVLLDLVLGDADGLDLLRRLRLHQEAVRARGDRRCRAQRRPDQRARAARRLPRGPGAQAHRRRGLRA